MQTVAAEKLVGVEHAFTKVRARGLQEKRADTAIDTCRRIATVPRPMEDKTQLAAATAAAQFSFGVEFGHPRAEDTRLCRGEVSKAVWRTTGAQKAIEILFTLFTPGHRVDPEQRPQVETMEQIMRLMRKHREEVAEPFEEVWRAAKDQTAPHGPVGKAYKVMREWGWQCP